MKVPMRFAVYGQKGQVLLVVIITMVVALTAGLVLASRTITNLKISKQNEDSQRAFQAASAGVDKYLQTPCPTGTTCSNSLSNATFNTKVEILTGNQILLNNGQLVDQDRGIDLWLSDYPDFQNRISGTITVYWGLVDQSTCAEGATLDSTSPALEVVLLSGTVGNPSLSKYVFDACASRRSSNNFQSPTAGATINNISFLNSTGAISVTNGLVAKVIPLYNSSTIGVSYSGLSTLPPQGKIIESTGTSGDVTRKIIYFESYPQVPNEIFPYAILSQ